MLRTRFLGILAIVSVFASPAVARPSDSPIVAPSVRILRGLANHPPRFLPPGIVTPEGFVGSLRFSKVLDADEISAVESLGVTFGRAWSRSGEADRAGTVYPAFVRWARLDAILRFPLLRQLETEPIVRPVPPLDVTRPLTGAPALSRQLALVKDEPPGKGIRIADVDSGLDPFHPAFFEADGGYFAWLDTNNDGKATFGVDAVDLDRNGIADPGEVLRFIDTPFINFFAGEHAWDLLYGSGKFEPTDDWLYADTNGNGKRDFGPGFGESAPAFGEPLFVADDVDHDGVLDPGEKLVRLGTSKFAKALVLGKEYSRGKNLTQVTSQMFGADGQGLPGALHGTGVAGILAGNNPGSIRFQGMAPAATLFMVDYSLDSGLDWEGKSMLERVAWLKAQDVHIALWEMSSWATTFMDGTSNLEKAMDALYQENGILQVVPAGNLATARKHMQATLAPGTTGVRASVPEVLPGYGVPFEVPMILLAVYYKGQPDDLGLRIRVPGAAAVDIPIGDQNGTALPQGQAAIASTALSEAGISFLMAMIFDQGQVKVPAGEWTFELVNASSAPLPVHGYLSDPISGWAEGVAFVDFESPESTLCHPSTADSALTVGAFGGEFGSPQELGAIRAYSSRGPRVDGVLGIDLAAPDDPFVPLPEADFGPLGGPKVVAAYSVFGGTSGAGPHVAGTLALLRQWDSVSSAAGLFDKIVSGTGQEPEMGELPSASWGHGRLDIYRAAFGVPAEPDAVPKAGLTATQVSDSTFRLDASGSSDPEGKTLQFRWDFDYDGTWDTVWETGAVKEREFPGPSVVKVAVRDPGGNVATALAIVQAPVIPVDPVPEPMPEPIPEPSPPDLAEDVTLTPDTSVPDTSESGVDAAPDPGSESPAETIAPDPGGTDEEVTEEVAGEAEDTAPPPAAGKGGGCASGAVPVSRVAFLVLIAMVLWSAAACRRFQSAGKPAHSRGTKGIYNAHQGC